MTSNGDWKFRSDHPRLRMAIGSLGQAIHDFEWRFEA
jgi:hypothetical protein